MNPTIISRDILLISADPSAGTAVIAHPDLDLSASFRGGLLDHYEHGHEVPPHRVSAWIGHAFRLFAALDPVAVTVEPDWADRARTRNPRRKP